MLVRHETVCCGGCGTIEQGCRWLLRDAQVGQTWIAQKLLLLLLLVMMMLMMMELLLVIL